MEHFPENKFNRVIVNTTIKQPQYIGTKHLMGQPNMNIIQMIHNVTAAAKVVAKIYSYANVLNDGCGTCLHGVWDMIE